MKKKNRDYTTYLDDIFYSSEKIEKYAKGFDEKKLIKDERAQDAIIRRFEIIGEAVKNLPADFRKKHSEIDWKKMAGMRDVLIHEYFGVNIKRIWKSIKEDVPNFKKKISKILNNLSQQKLP